MSNCRFDVTSSLEQHSSGEGNTPIKTSSQPRRSIARAESLAESSTASRRDPDLNRMVTGGGMPPKPTSVTSVSSKVAGAESFHSTVSIRFAANGDQGSESAKKKPRDTLTSLTSLTGEVGVKARLRRTWWWTLSKCFACARNRRFAKSGMSSVTHSDFQGQIGDHRQGDVEDIEAAAQRHWGALIAPSSDQDKTPLFQSFRSQGRVTSACLWHACRAVTVGALLIIMGITMAVLGKLLILHSFHVFYELQLIFWTDLFSPHYFGLD